MCCILVDLSDDLLDSLVYWIFGIQEISAGLCEMLCICYRLLVQRGSVASGLTHICFLLVSVHDHNTQDFHAWVNQGNSCVVYLIC